MMLDHCKRTKHHDWYSKHNKYLPGKESKRNGGRSPPSPNRSSQTLDGGPEQAEGPSQRSFPHFLFTSPVAMPPMLNSSATHARMSPPSPRVRKLEAVSDSSQKDLGHVILATLQQRVAITSLRSLFSCVGVGETEPFKLPPQHRMLVQMKTNANYFATNYLLLTVGVFAFLLMFFHPIQLLVCIVVGYGWHVFLTKKEIPTDKLEIFGRRLSEQDILLAATGSTMVFLLFFVLPSVIFALSVSSLASAVHALLRNNRLKDDSFDERSDPPKAEELV